MNVARAFLDSALFELRRTKRLGEGALHQGLALSAAPLPRLDLERACRPEPGGTNLVENGIRYSLKATGKATLKVIAGVAKRAGDVQPYIHIIDKGPGIDEEAEALLFEPFHTTESSGTGLGLYISKELCEANQSQLLYGRDSDGKSRFSIFFE